MKPKRIASEILALARRIESGATAIGDFLRAEMNLRFPERNSRETLPLDAATFDAMRKLGEAVRFAFRENDNTYGMLMQQLGLMYYGIGTGQLRSTFFARIGVK